jgi:hypothetical protein
MEGRKKEKKERKDKGKRRKTEIPLLLSYKSHYNG